MKVLPTIAGVILAGSFATTANAGPSQGAIMSLCKTEIKNSFEDVARIRTSRFKERAHSTLVTYRVSFKEAPATKITCAFKDGITSLTDKNGAMVASKTSQENTGS